MSGLRDDKPILRYDPVSHVHWLEFDDKPDEATRQLLKSNGWRWSSYREQWRTNRRYAQVPVGIEYTDGGTCDYANERADRLEERAAKHHEKGEAAYQQHRRIADMIPFGQPILVGHHSEGRHRRDLARDDRAMGTFITEERTAERLEGAAQSSRAHQRYKETPGAMSRRRDRLATELRLIERNLQPLASRSQSTQVPSAYLAEQERRRLILLEEITELDTAITASGGLRSDHADIRKGDIILLRGHTVRVARVNRKTISGVITEGPVAGWVVKEDKSYFQKIIRRADGTCPTADTPADTE